MKRILLSVFAVAITAAWAVPATAGDVTFGGQYRLRGEYLNNTGAVTGDNTNDFDDDAPDSNDFWAQRVRLTANANATDDTSVKITIQDTRTFGSTSLLSDDGSNGIDLHEAYVNVANIFGAPVALRAGRQELNYGDQRLIGGFGWSNNGRAFDGFKAMYTNDAVDVDLFTTTISEDGVSINDDTSFSGVYATIKQLVPDNTVDLYLLHQSDSLGDNRYTLGARLAGAMSGVDYTLEVPYQFGEVVDPNDVSLTPGDVDISAWAVAVKAGYTLPTAMKIRVGAEYDYGTGEASNGTMGGENNSFTSLYPTNHNHFGIGDFTTATNTWSNISAWSINASADVNEKINLYAAYWNYTANRVLANASDELGSEFDLVGKYKYSNNVGIEAGLSRFFPGDGTTGGGTNPDDDADFAYLQLTANF